jgi:hypothetical protein
LFVCLTLAAACSSPASPAPTSGPSTSPTGVASTAIGPSASGASAVATAPNIGGDGTALAAGTYTVSLDRIAVSGSKLPPIQVTVPDGWHSGGWLINQPRAGQDVPPISVQFWVVNQVYKDPCHWQGALLTPGPTVGDLVTALVAQPTRNATQPTDVTLDGYTGKYLEWSVPTAVDFATCDTDGGQGYFQSWEGSVIDGAGGPRYQQGPGQVDRLWILDVNGTRLVIDAFSMPSATSTERQALLDVVKSIKFQR